MTYTVVSVISAAGEKFSEIDVPFMVSPPLVSLLFLTRGGVIRNIPDVQLKVTVLPVLYNEFL